MSPAAASTHPMGAREKIALFNMLGPLEGLKVLDAYAGSGAPGIEALSRGAAAVTFVEKDPRVAAVIRQNLASLGLISSNNPSSAKSNDLNLTQPPSSDPAKLNTIFVQSVATFCQSAAPGQKFDLILADPPYDHFDPTEVSKLADFLAPAGILALSHPGEAPNLPQFKLLKSHRYARAHISLYQRI